MNDIQKREVGSRIRALRKARGENQTEFAKKINATLPAVSNWETGKNLPNNERLKTIAELGNISVDQLLNNDYNQLKSVDTELIKTLNDYVNNKKELLRYELNLFKDSTIEGMLSVVGLGKGFADDSVKNYEKHTEQIDSLHEFGKNYIKSSFYNFTFDDFSKTVSDPSIEDYYDFINKEKEKLELILDRFWVSLKNENQAYQLINKLFTDKIIDDLEILNRTAIKEGREEYYTINVLKPFLDETAKNFKEYIKDYTDTEN